MIACWQLQFSVQLFLYIGNGCLHIPASHVEAHVDASLPLVVGNLRWCTYIFYLCHLRQRYGSPAWHGEQ